MAGIVQSLSGTGRLANTMIVVMSAIGFPWGEHRWGATGAQQKQVPHEESIRVPIVIRDDPLTNGPRTDPRMALSIDLAPAFAEPAGVGAPGAEGTSLLPALGISPLRDGRTSWSNTT